MAFERDGRRIILSEGGGGQLTFGKGGHELVINEG